MLAEGDEQAIGLDTPEDRPRYPLPVSLAPTQETVSAHLSHFSLDRVHRNVFGQITEISKGHIKFIVGTVPLTGDILRLRNTKTRC